MVNFEDLDKAFAGSGKSPFDKYSAPGTTVTGTITAVDYRQQTEYGTNQPAVFPSGDPKMQFVIQLQTTEHDDPDDDGIRALYINAWGSKKQALAAAIQASGAHKASEILVPGTVMTATFVGEKQVQGKTGTFTQKDYTYTLVKGAPAGIDQALSQAAAQPVQQGYVQQPAAQPTQQVPAAQQAPQPVQTPIQQTPQPAAPAIDPAVVAKVLPLLQFGTPLDTLTRATGVDEATVRQVAAANGLQVA
ncbi:hypothetical protein F8O06_02830 [Pseudoclavibacter sp. CFCC 14310]|uniref:hypothetical protein n=1 Tax=Pseudoclavibacter sp. CFCC 14310 TaxID=2615180 RepID=UPI00130112EC|nr:hypothetical protein [Pseudoclavibacter sp. CFCC 14310]KAB1647492.1 hypothetical protein F8O06_02830 [Pseudoclavibacter sp. CFCC 14310]